MRLDRIEMWKILEDFGIPDTYSYIKIVKVAYRNFIARMDHNGHLPQEIKTKKRNECDGNNVYPTLLSFEI